MVLFNEVADGGAVVLSQLHMATDTANNTRKQ
jgi:hypothetical protein